MQTLLVLLLNIVYGLLFFLAMGVALLTTGAFAAALWDKVLRPLLRR